jgi:FlaA1/EpsC-like NDP-sugar epimerase
MTIPEAAELVIQAGGLDSDGDIYILDMGEQIKIYDLIIKLLEINNLSLKNNENPNGDIEIKIIGIRPGEKILEELIDQDGVYIDTIHSKIKRIVEKENNVLDHPEDVINKLRLLIEKSDVKNLDNFINSYKEKNL